MITHSDIARRRRNHERILSAIQDSGEWWTADEIVKISGVARTSVYRAIKRLLHDGNIEVAREMTGGKQENAQLFRATSLDNVTDPSGFTSDKAMSEAIRHRMRERMSAWASNQQPGWSAYEASDYAGVPKGYVDTFLKIQSAIGDYVIVGSRVSKSRHMETLYAYQPKTKPRPDNIFKALIVYGHDEDFQDREPAESTSAAPGSPEKVEVMRRRVERGEALTHPCDNRQILTPSCGDPSEVEAVRTKLDGRVIRKKVRG